MNIILAEERAGRQMPERSFSQAVIVFGRDAVECDVAFENTEFPQVSRRHAEIRWSGGKWLVADLNSSYGTFLNGKRITQIEPLAVGASLQFGIDGPVMRVVWFEVPTDAVTEVWSASVIQGVPVAEKAPAAAAASVPGFVSTAVPSTEPPASLSPRISENPVLKFDEPTRPPYMVQKQNVWLGRDPSCDVIFDAKSAMVSRRHAEVRQEAGDYFLADNNSFNGTLVNGQRISAPVPLYDDDQIQLGVGGPVITFSSPARSAPAGASLAGQRSISSSIDAVSKTMVLSLEKASAKVPSVDPAQAQLLMSVTFPASGQLTIGRGKSNDIKLDGLQISKKHARLTRSGSGISIEDLHSTNGVFVNGARVTRQTIVTTDLVQIASFLLRIDQAGNVGVFDTRSRHRIDAVNITKEVKNRAGGGRIKLLDGVSLSIQPNEFVGVLGPSGSGKSTLIKALNGVRPATSGNVLVNDLDLYRHFDSLRQAIGYVPQEDVIHRELSVYRTLYYVAKLRLSRDVSSPEIGQIIDEVLDVTGLTERRNMPVGRLSGGQRKRVSIAVELITKPSVIFLDEPTSGLDPATEERVMRLFRQIAESGRTVVMTTHAMENVRLFDKILVLMRGKLAFYGTPGDALRYFNAASFKDLYDRLERPAGGPSGVPVDSSQLDNADQAAEKWRKRFLETPQYRELVQEPLKQLGKLQKTTVHKRRRLGIVGAFSQWLTLTRRYFRVLLKDKLNLFILFSQAPVIALLTLIATGQNEPRDFLYFVVALVAIWFGTSVSAREIIRERPVYRRERMFNLGILPYLGSKLFVLSIIVGVQCAMLFVPLKIFDFLGLMPMPGEWQGAPQFFAMLLTAGVGIALGLLVSSLVRTSEMATSLVPLILIPQILLSGLMGVPSGINRVAGLAMPAAWSFDTMKRFSTLDTLEPEGSNPKGKHKGLGLFKHIEQENEKMIADARKDLDELKKAAGMQFQDLPPGAGDLPDLNDVKKIPDDLSRYVTFLHPWMDERLNQIVLMLMFGMLVIATLIVLRLQDLV